ncbi:hypothetical protein FB567DRAFT_587430 [Paraphoma chrysanthemicola]|uniref:Uncharacterized protein n=1 Tax=Paraphoma chrysanthemicola TaxID=798071 RepID=A0A8K0W363_9PLEO|nr:hypothetical protein FB567DRAFT_587430 [Paraphoma chrysanthemicola]
MRPPTSELSPAGQMYEHEYNRACELWKADRREEAYIICRRLLADPFVGKWHQAGFHLLLGYSDDRYVEHAQRARDLYKTMYDNSDNPPTPEETETLEKYMNIAEEVLKAAQEDETREEGDGEGADEDGVGGDGDNTVDSGDELIVEITSRAGRKIDADEWESVTDSDERETGIDADDDIEMTDRAGQAINPDEWESVIDSDEWEPVNDDDEDNESGVVEAETSGRNKLGEDVDEDEAAKTKGEKTAERFRSMLSGTITTSESSSKKPALPTPAASRNPTGEEDRRK